MLQKSLCMNLKCHCSHLLFDDFSDVILTHLHFYQSILSSFIIFFTFKDFYFFNYTLSVPSLHLFFPVIKNLSMHRYIQIANSFHIEVCFAFNKYLTLQKSSVNWFMRLLQGKFWPIGTVLTARVKTLCLSYLLINNCKNQSKPHFHFSPYPVHGLTTWCLIFVITDIISQHAYQKSMGG